MNDKLREWIRFAKEPMESLRDAIGETVGLGILDFEQAEGIVIDWVPGTSGLSFHYETDFRFQLHSTAPGKILLAFSSNEIKDSLIQRIKLVRFNERTITSKEKLREELSTVGKCGYALDHAEQVEGCHCVGAPVTNSDGSLLAALWVTGIASMIHENSFADIAKQVTKFAADITNRITHASDGNVGYHLMITERAKELMALRIDQQIDMETLASELKVGYSWFRRIFKRHTGVSPNQYHMQIRLDKARNLLLSTDLSVKEISDQLGYQTQDYFSSLFKKKTGLSPSVFRRQSGK